MIVGSMRSGCGVVSAAEDDRFDPVQQAAAAGRKCFSVDDLAVIAHFPAGRSPNWADDLPFQLRRDQPRLARAACSST